ncbi:alanine/glycine:cation symporter family protein [Fredinandcohnia salidurans]|uniref:Alanine/glycine:cation symporter family protein n=1 Tax=Fredinandcohnia salidurans TaxID=2595041 RepID=A0ABW4MVK6_9BACI
METFQSIIGWLAGIIWGPWLIVTLVGVGVYFTIGTKFIQIRKLPFIFSQTFGKAFKKDSDIKGEGTLTPRQAVSTALASTIGVGNIVGVATAIAMGGPGAIFWMWVSGFFGMCTKYAEIVLSIQYREKGKDGTFMGGPAWYMKKGLNSSFLAVFFTIGLALACIGGNMVQANSVSQTFKENFNIPSIWVGIVMVILVTLVSLGGVKVLGRVTEIMVPIMALFFIFGGLIVIFQNITEVPGAFGLIIKSAFAPTSVGGGIAGFAVMEAVRYGISRGLYSNEAGQGTAPIAHATAKTDHPVRQGLWGITEVFINTFLICTITALTILTTGVLGPDSNPAVLTSVAFGTVHPIFQYIVSISLILFAFSTVIGLAFYGATLAKYIGGEKLSNVYRFVYLPFTFIGAVGGLQMIWGIVDVLIGVAVIPNLIALLFLSPLVFKLTNEFFADPTKFDLKYEKSNKVV